MPNYKEDLVLGSSTTARIKGDSTPEASSTFTIISFHLEKDLRKPIVRPKLKLLTLVNSLQAVKNILQLHYFWGMQNPDLSFVS